MTVGGGIDRRRHRCAGRLLWGLSDEAWPGPEVTSGVGPIFPTISPTWFPGNSFRQFPALVRHTKTHSDTMKGGRVTAKPEVEALFGAK
jgi:hypothetical protein